MPNLSLISLTQALANNQRSVEVVAATLPNNRAAIDAYSDTRTASASGFNTLPGGYVTAGGIDDFANKSYPTAQQEKTMYEQEIAKVAKIQVRGVLTRPKKHLMNMFNLFPFPAACLLAQGVPSTTMAFWNVSTTPRSRASGKTTK